MKIIFRNQKSIFDILETFISRSITFLPWFDIIFVKKISNFDAKVLKHFQT